MRFHSTAIFAAFIGVASVMSTTTPAPALTMKECSAKYKAAQTTR